METPEKWIPPFTWEERLKYTLLPTRLYTWNLLRRHLRKGDPELKLLPQLVDRNKIAIDVGANKGVYSHLLSRLCPEVHAFEANPKMFQVLTRPGALPPRTKAYGVAISDHAGVAELVVPLHRGGFSNQHPSLNPLKKSGAHGIVKVETRTLDSYDFRNVGFIKIDVEGFERAVLEGARETLRRERPTVLVEMEERHTGEPIEASLARMKEIYDCDGFFLRDGQLRPITELDPEAEHRRAVGTRRYVFNFIFRPQASSRI
jgi:FkbM family methyltransferase